MKICIFGASQDVNNMGCRALSSSLINLFYTGNNEAEIILMYGNREGGKRQVHVKDNTIDVPICNLRMSFKDKISKHLLFVLFLSILYKFIPLSFVRNYIKKNDRIKTLLDCDIIGDIRGGDSFSDIYGFSTIFWGSMTCFITILLNKKLFFFPQTYGPYKHPSSRLIAKYLLSHAELILSRDYKSIDFIKETFPNIYNSKEILFCPDVAFILKPIQPTSINIEPSLDIETEDFIGVNVSGLLYVKGIPENNPFGLKINYKTFIHDFIINLSNQTQKKILILPHEIGFGYHCDSKACKEVENYLHEKDVKNCYFLHGDYNQHEIKYIIGKSNFFIGSRMHACIAALSQGIPSIPLAYSRKFEGAYGSIGFTDLVIDTKSCDEKETSEQFWKLYDSREEIRKRIAEKMPAVREQVFSTFHDKILSRRS